MQMELLTHSSFWSGILVPGIPLAEKLVRTLIVYTAVLLGLKLAGKRELSQLNPFDLVVLLLLSNTVQNAIIGNDNSVLGGLFGAGVLLLVNHFLVRYLFRSGRLDKVEGSPDVLISNGEVLECRLETGGALTFVPKTPTIHDMEHRELIARLDRIERALVKRIA
jgi:hypothetical protein